MWVYLGDQCRIGFTKVEGLGNSYTRDTTRAVESAVNILLKESELELDL